jgi:steroid delta-isomerase-like uncharacterized protein
MPFANKELVRRLYKEVWNERKFQVAEELLSKTHALADPTLGGSSVGPSAYLGQVKKLVNAFPDLRFHIDELICEKDKVVVSWVASGTHRGEMLGIVPTNKKVSISGITIHQLANGKILDSLAVWDAYHLMQQLGVLRAEKAEAHAVSSR